MKRELKYLLGHWEAGHLDYSRFRSSKVPIGSGVVESAVRRVINLRFKSASQCWCESRLESLMELRALLKSSRWDDVMPSILSGASHLCRFSAVISSV